MENKKGHQIRLAERGGFEQSPSNPPEASLQSDLANGQAQASLTASQNTVNGSPELSELFHSWPKLPANARLAILALIHATLNPK
jgi:hypothetical protein